MAQLKDTIVNGNLTVSGSIKKGKDEVALDKNLTSHTGNTSNPHGVTATQVGLGNVPNKTEDQFKQMAFDVMFPIGKVVQQLPGEESPKTMYNKNGIKSNWQDITSNYNGRFFKISTSAVGTTTPESLPNITGYFKGGYSGNGADADSNGVFLNLSEKTNFSPSLDSLTGYNRTKFAFNAWRSSSVYKDGAKVQPDNISIKLWKRIP